MQLRTKALDCLYLNWALPRSSAPELPPPLTYQVHDWQGEDYVFASVLLFRLTGLRLDALRLPALSYPQMNCRVYVHDADGVPSVLFRRMLVPFWAVPVSRYLGRQPATAARFNYPPPSRRSRSDVFSWSIDGRLKLEVIGRLGSPGVGVGPRLGSWENTLDYFRQRPRGYVVWNGRLRPITTSRAAPDVWPLEIEIGNAELVADCFGEVNGEFWHALHSAWLCPEIPFRFELAELRALSLAGRGIPAASAS